MDPVLLKPPRSPEILMDVKEDRTGVVSPLSNSSGESSSSISYYAKSNALKKEIPRVSTATSSIISRLSTPPDQLMLPFMPYRFIGWNILDTVRTTSPFIYRINDGNSNNNILQEVCEERQWKEFKEASKVTMMSRELYDNSGWNLWWSYNFYQGSSYRTLKCWQYTNHNPRGFQFCNKSYLTGFLRKMSSEYGEIFDFGPRSFIMPEDYIRFVMEHTRRQEQVCPDAHNVILEVYNRDNAADLQNNNPPSKPKSFSKKEHKIPIWILKPVGKSQGKGIVLTKDIGHMANVAQRSVVQEYISRPLLIGGYKWDIRIYVCVTCTDPLVIYLYREGLCRFATEKFDLSDLSATFAHLTNASLNKLGDNYPTEKEVIGSGCKWSLKQLREYFKKSGISDWYLWQRIMSMVVLTVVGEGLRAGYMYPCSKNCFDFFGFDILVDQNLRPWLLEVNYSPGLGGDCEVDKIVKKPMLHELFDLLGFPDANSSDSSINKSLPHSRKSERKREHDFITKAATQKIKPPVTQPSVDISCKGRFKDASSIYTQDLVYTFLENNSKNPNFRMSASMKAVLLRKRADSKRKRKEQKTNAESQIETNSDQLLDSETLSSSDSENTSSAQNNKPSPPPSRPNTPNQRRVYSALEAKAEELASPFIYLQRQEWSHPPKNAGNWVLVYPCKAYPYRSPYRSSLADLRGIVKTVEHYMEIAQFVFKTFPNQTDLFYQNKVKSLYKWDIEVWNPPGEQTQSGEDIDDDTA